ncbi:MAG: sugar phosphate isomerase/epimerase [Chloroflexi bacterium]|nr:sugar phosphate isomerase/epimerase [Chloroflexota bacterium]
MEGQIRIGMCMGLDQVPALAPGYDYVELGVSGTLVPLEDDAAYAPTGAILQTLLPPVRAFNLFLPGSVKITGPDVNWDLVQHYCRRAMQRARDAGASVIVIGSGGARRVPDGYSHALAWGQLVRAFNIAGDEAVKQDITIAIEPLNTKECNIINSYLEGVQLAKDVDHAAVRVLADIYHFVMDAEPIDDILAGPEWLAHVHLADTGRRFPGSGTYPLPRLFAILKDIGYTGMASVECSWGPDYTDETNRALGFLRSLLD